VSTGINKRDNHLRSADFFDAEHHPDITVTVNAAVPAENDEVNVSAELSIRGNTVALPMRAKVTALADGCIRVTATTTVEREQLGVSGNIAGMVAKTTTVAADAVFRRAGS
jgi:polyisoprenoid-binding protein YceI